MRSRMLTTALVLGAFSVITSGVGPARAQADDKKAACAAAYEASQELRGGGQLIEAEEKLVVCSDEACPAFVRTDCSGWLEEVRRDVPSITVTAKDGAGEATTKVRVLLGDTVLAEELSDEPLPLNPGKHTLRFELEGADPIEQEIELEKGSKAHAIELIFKARGSDLPADDPYDASAAGAADEETADEGGKPGKLRPYAYIAGGVGAAGIIGWAVLGAMGKGEESDLRDTCSPSCSESQVDSVRTKYLFADISLGLGIAGLGTGVALFFLSQPKGDESSAEADAGRVELDVRAARGGGFATVSGRF